MSFNCGAQKAEPLHWWSLAKLEACHKGTQTLAGVKKKLALAAFAIIYICAEGAAACSQLTGSLSLFIHLKQNNEKNADRHPLAVRSCLSDSWTLWWSLCWPVRCSATSRLWFLQWRGSHVCRLSDGVELPRLGAWNVNVSWWSARDLHPLATISCACFLQNTQWLVGCWAGRAGVCQENKSSWLSDDEVWCD